MIGFRNQPIDVAVPTNVNVTHPRFLRLYRVAFAVLASIVASLVPAPTSSASVVFDRSYGNRAGYEILGRFQNRRWAEISDFAVRPNGDIVVAGARSHNLAQDFFVRVMKSDGRPNLRFGAGGRVTLP